MTWDFFHHYIFTLENCLISEEKAFKLSSLNDKAPQLYGNLC